MKCIKEIQLHINRKNWLFSDSQAGANVSMVVYTMVEMAKAHGLHPYSYLTSVTGVGANVLGTP